MYKKARRQLNYVNVNRSSRNCPASFRILDESASKNTCLPQSLAVSSSDVSCESTSVSATDSDTFSSAFPSESSYTGKGGCPGILWHRPSIFVLNPSDETACLECEFTDFEPFAIQTALHPRLRCGVMRNTPQTIWTTYLLDCVEPVIPIAFQRRIPGVQFVAPNNTNRLFQLH